MERARVRFLKMKSYSVVETDTRNLIVRLREFSYFSFFTLYRIMDIETSIHKTFVIVSTFAGTLGWETE